MFGVTILGSNSAIPAYNRHPAAQAVHIDNQVILLDCGEGTQMQMNAYKIKKNKIRHIFISHLHGDHYFGLVGLLNTMALLGRTETLHLYGPALLFDLIGYQMRLTESVFPFVVEQHPLCSEGIIVEEPGFSVSVFSVWHRIECWGFVIREKQKLKKLRIEEAQKHEIPATFYLPLKKGQNFIKANGEVIENEKLTFSPPPAMSYAYCADTQYTEAFLPAIKDVTLLFHEATYLHDMQEKAFGRYHSTALQAGLLAKKANAKRLIIGHFSSQYYDLLPLLREAQSVFPASELAKEGATFLVR